MGSAPWTWDDIFDQLLEELGSTLLENDQDEYYETIERVIRLYFRPRIGRQVARETTTSDLDQLWLDLLAIPRAPKYVTNMRGTLSLAANAAVRWKVLDRNLVALAPMPARAPKVGRLKKAVVIPLRPEEAHRLRMWLVNNWFRRSQNALALLCCLETGARRGEVLGLRWDGVDFDQRTFTFVEQAKRPKNGQVRLGSLKTLGSERTVSVSHLLLDQLRAHQRRVGTGSDGLVFCHPDGRARNPDKLNDWVRLHMPWDTEIGLKRRPQPHLLRHTHASLLLLAGETIPNVSERLGHSVSTTTLEIYAHAVRARSDDTASIWDKFMQDAGEH